jgi:hypothetical protein
MQENSKNLWKLNKQESHLRKKYFQKKISGKPYCDETSRYGQLAAKKSNQLPLNIAYMDKYILCRG